MASSSSTSSAATQTAAAAAAEEEERDAVRDDEEKKETDEERLARMGPEAYWGARWNDGVPRGDRFDMDAPLPLVAALDAEGALPQTGRVLIPGCGRGYEVHVLANERRHVTGMDLSPTAMEEAREYARTETETPEECFEFRAGDFFALEGESFDLVYDYTFFCAIEPSMRQAWVQKMAEIVRPGGQLLCGIFPIGDKAGGPPFAVSLELMAELIEPAGFERLQLEMLPDELNHAERVGHSFGQSGVGRWRRK